MSSYEISRDGIADLALNTDLEKRLLDAIDKDPQIGWAVEEAISAHIDEHGVTQNGEWLGEWSALEIVESILGASRGEVMEIKEFSQIIITGATWAQVVLAVTDPDGNFAPGFANAPRSWAQLAKAAMEQAEIQDLAQQVILMSSQPGFGAQRSFTAMDGTAEPQIEDWCGGYWNVLMEDTLTWAEWTSGSSHSTITVERESNDSWTIVGEFPVTDGVRYEGTYFGALQTAVADVRRKQEAVAA